MVIVMTEYILKAFKIRNGVYDNDDCKILKSAFNLKSILGTAANFAVKNPTYMLVVYDAYQNKRVATIGPLE